MTVCNLMYAAALERKLLDQSPQNLQHTGDLVSGANFPADLQIK